MSLARAWMRQLFGASGAALLVPGAVACAVAVLAFAGGFSRFDALGQAVSGPAPPMGSLTRIIPGTANGVAAAIASLGTGAARPAGHDRAVAPAAGGSSRVSGAGGTRGGSATGSGHGSGRAANPHRGDGSGTGGSSGGSGGSGRSGGSGGPGRSGAGGGAPAPTVVDQAAGAASGVASQVPAPVGPAVTAAIHQIASSVDAIAPIRVTR